MHCGTVNVAGLANYLHIPDLEACDFFAAFAFHWYYFCTFFFFRATRTSAYCLLPASCLVLGPQLEGLCNLESHTDVARGTSTTSFSIPSGDVDLQKHFKDLSLRLSSCLYLKALLAAL